VDAGGRLLVPMRDRAGELHSLQYITAEGEKRFLPGGSVRGFSLQNRVFPDLHRQARTKITGKPIRRASSAICCHFGCR
jgi:phage/plasmid primase-like uncharacterized protein